VTLVVQPLEFLVRIPSVFGSHILVSEWNLQSLQFAFAWCPFQTKIPQLRLFEDRTFMEYFAIVCEAVEKNFYNVLPAGESPDEINNSDGITRNFLS
jgi:hypothetical protein